VAGVQVDRAIGGSNRWNRPPGLSAVPTIAHHENRRGGLVAAPTGQVGYTLLDSLAELIGGVRPMTHEYADHCAIVETGWLLAAAP
jgi:hypothetical protein